MKNTEMLKKNYEFRKVLVKGKFYCGKILIAHILKNKTQKNYLGLAISAKIGKATKRNRIKRLIRESYLNIESDVTTGNSIIFLWRKEVPIEEAQFNKIKHDMLTIFKEAGILKK